MGDGHALGHRLREIVKTGFVKYTAGTVALVLIASLLMFFFEYDISNEAIRTSATVPAVYLTKPVLTISLSR
jgi:hypothetical protein